MRQKKNKNKTDKKSKERKFGKLNCYVVVWRQQFDDVPLWVGKNLEEAQAIAEALLENPDRRRDIVTAVDLPMSGHITVEIYRFEDGLLRGRLHIEGTPEKQRKTNAFDASLN